MAQGSFAASVGSWVAATKQRTLAVRNEAAQRIVEEMQLPGPSVGQPGSSQGGHLPVVSGYLRASLVSINGTSLPTMTINPNTEQRYTYNAGETALVIADAAITDTLTFVYSAAYARKMEEKYAFVRLTAQNWQRVVTEVVAEAQTRAAK